MSNININAREYLLKGNKDVGIVVVHGFTSSPSYMRYIAKDLNNLGYSVFVPLLAGHGTTEENLRYGNSKTWYDSVASAIEKIRSTGVHKVYLVGHSLGGLISLLMAENQNADGVVTVAAPIKLFNYYRIKLFSLLSKNSFYTMNKPDGKEDMFRYYRADGASICNLLAMIKTVKKGLSKVTVPTMVVFSKDDLTVMPESADIIYNGINSSSRMMVEITGNHHECIVDSRGQYIEKIHRFIEETS